MENGSNGLLFDGWHSWSSYIGKAITGLVTCLFSVIYAIAFGVATLFVYSYKKIKQFVLTYPVPVLSFLCVFLAICLLVMFVDLSAKIKTCQAERDKVAYEKMKLERAFVGDTIVIRGYSTRQIKTTTIEE